MYMTTQLAARIVWDSAVTVIKDKIEATVADTVEYFAEVKNHGNWPYYFC
jgi:hypothetical protein